MTDRSALGRKSRRKGARGELSVIADLKRELGMELNRNYKQVAEAQLGDVEQLVGGFLLEVKNCARIDLPAWWRQTVTAASKRGAVPCLVFKERGKWRYVIPMGEASHQWALELAYTRTLYLSGFCLVVRESMGNKL